ncbi:Cell division protein FtsZ [Mycovorax composti]|jgi:cell division protein FtsZ|uniref:Cell division protein FtsZ n=2 Tax=Chitinophagaceae TaxID=563835 RepID=A0ABZ2EG80_9BACT
MIQFDLPKEQSSIIKVIGVGGGGGNAVNYMFKQNIEGVNFIICNTDAQALAQSNVPNRIQLGPQLTAGLGAGANPEIGRQACEESLEEIRRILEVNTKMVFITAGMGGGTGTGGAPIIAKVCRDMGVLTVGIVTMPFAYEGKKRQQQAEEGIKQLRQYVDTLLVISNDKLRHQFGNLRMREAFEKADNVLATAAKCITDVINSTGQINVDFADVCTVMRNGGVAILGSATASGENRAQRAIEEALNSPLLNDNDIRGAKWILININSAEGEHEFTMDEVEIIQSHLLSQAGEDTDVILGMGYDSSLGDQIGITLIATGFENKDTFVKPVLKKGEPEEKIVMTLKPLNEEKSSVEVIAPVTEPAEPLTPVTEPVSLELQPDPLAPKLVEEIPFMDAPMPTVEDVVNENEETHYLLGDENSDAQFAAAEQMSQDVPVTDKVEEIFKSPSVPGDRVFQYPKLNEEATDALKAEPVRSYLSKPVNIYAEEDHTDAEQPQEEQAQETEGAEMTMFEKPEVTNEYTSFTQTTDRNERSNSASLEDMEMQKRRQIERIQKLRNLSYNVNANNPTDEFENVPAYIRRNIELRNYTSHVESYYSKFEVSSDDKNQGQINTLNAFLDGEKPD